MNLAYIVLLVGLMMLVVVKLTMDKVESVRYRQNLKSDKLARKARLARKAQEERLANIERKLVMNAAISNSYKSSELLDIGFSKVSDNKYSSPIVEVLEKGSGDTVSVKRYYVSVELQDGKIKSCTKQYLQENKPQITHSC